MGISPSALGCVALLPEIHLIRVAIGRENVVEGLESSSRGTSRSSSLNLEASDTKGKLARAWIRKGALFSIPILARIMFESIMGEANNVNLKIPKEG